MFQLCAFIFLSTMLAGDANVMVRCEQRCPNCPAITVKEHAPSDTRFPGTTADYRHGVHFGSGLGGMRDDAISFVHVPDGFTVILFEHDQTQIGFKMHKGVGSGESIRFTGPYEGELPPRMNDKTSLLVVVQTKPCTSCDLRYDDKGGYKVGRANVALKVVPGDPCKVPQDRCDRAERERRCAEQKHVDDRNTASEVRGAKERSNAECDKADACKDGKKGAERSG